MKLPKWLVAGLLVLSFGTPLVGLAWWWLNWPDWTMKQFVDHVTAGRLEHAYRMIEPQMPLPFDDDSADPADRKEFAEGILTASVDFERRLNDQPRSSEDYILGRRRFGFYHMAHLPDLEFTAQQGRVKCDWLY